MLFAFTFLLKDMIHLSPVHKSNQIEEFKKSKIAKDIEQAFPDANLTDIELED